MSASYGTLITFYSYKGGVGRSMCLANVAALLAGYGRRVLIIDWDLEAPGIERYFLNSPSRLEGERSRFPGLVDLVQAFSSRTPFVWRDCLLRAYPFGTKASVAILTAGRDDPDYPARVRAINWETLFSQGFGDYLEDLRSDWLSEFDFVLLDSRTGFTDVGNICTIHLPDVLMLFFTTNQQSLDGVVDVARRARAMSLQLPYDRKKMLVLPVPARDETQSQQMEAIEWRKRFAKQLWDFYLDWVPKGRTPEDILEKLRIPYKPYWSFGERLPVSERGVDDHLDVGYAYQTVAKLVHFGFNWDKVFPSEPVELKQQERLGGLIREAEGLLSRLGESPAAMVRSLLLRLVFVALPEQGVPDSRRWVPLDELSGGERDVLALVEQARLIERDADGSKIQLADAGLVSEWPLLKGWLDQDRELLVLRQKLISIPESLDRTQIERTVVLQKGSGLSPSPREEEAIERSVSILRRRARLRWIGALAGLLIVAGIGWRQWNEQRQTRLLRASLYAAQAGNLGSDDHRAAFAALLMVEAGELDPDKFSNQSSRLKDAAARLLAVRVDQPPPDLVWTDPKSGDPDGFRLQSRENGVVQMTAGGKDDIVKFLIHGSEVVDSAFSADLRFVRTRSDGKEIVWRGPYYSLKNSLRHDAEVWGIAFLPDGRLATASSSVRLWDVSGGREVFRFEGRSMLRAVAPDPAGSVLAAGGWDRLVSIRDVSTGKLVGSFPMKSPLLALAWSPDGRLLAAGGEDGSVHVLSRRGWEPVAMATQPSAVTAIAFDSSGSRFITAGLDGVFRTWRTGASRSSRAQMESGVKGSVGGGTGFLYADGAVAVQAGFWGLKIRDLYIPGRFTDLAARRDAGYLWLTAVSGSAALVTLRCSAGWADCARVSANTVHPGVRTVAWSQAGGVLATAGEDGVVRVWDGQIQSVSPCSLIGRNLNPTEWTSYLGNEPYRKLCADLP